MNSSTNMSLLDSIPLWLVIGGIVLSVCVSIELGYRFGRYRSRLSKHDAEAPVGTMIGATLGLLAFILAFTFGLAASQFQARREMVVEEANAIGTAFMRAGMIAPPHSKEVRRILREYVDVRLEVIEKKNVEETLRRSDELHRLLWQETERVGQLDEHSITAGLFIEAINNVIDLHTKRIQVGLRNRLPLSLWMSLFLLTVFAMSGVGYHEGLFKSSRSPATWILIASFSTIIVLVADLDRPQEGMLVVSQEAILTLRDTIQETR